MKTLVRLGLAVVVTFTSMSSRAVELCENVFAPSGRFQDLALDLSIEKAIDGNGKFNGLSPKDLKLIVEKVFEEQEGRQYQVSSYWTETATARTAAVLARTMDQEMTNKGLLRYFEDRGLLIDKSNLRTRLTVIRNSETFNRTKFFALIAISALRGSPPVTLPRIFFKISPEDHLTLLLHGMDSPEGKEIIQRYKLKQELIRGYTLFSRYYTVIALAVVIYLLYENSDKYLEKMREAESENAFDTLVGKIEKLYNRHAKMKSKEDVLFDTVTENFVYKFHREPSEGERLQICVKIYGAKGCQ
ncbi:MAG TPA: hypothetical protein VN132_04090 [Bdellovibrio sp.]|nr:hypothetical protein [Bdellovibrio sp.]